MTPAIVVAEMPLLCKGIICRFCGMSINDSHVYSVEGTAYRCETCAGKLVKQIKELRDGNYEVRKEKL
jgi:hypothetical protein